MMTEEKEERRSKDKNVNRKGTGTLIEGLRSRGCFGREGERTCIGERGASVVDLVIANTELSEEIADVREEERTELDHFPLEVVVREKRVEEEDKKGRKEKSRVVRTTDWSKEGIESYHNRCKEWKVKEENVESIWEEINEAVRKEVKEVKVWRMRDRAWHGKEWKRELRKELRKLRKGRISREEFWGKRNKYK